MAVPEWYFNEVGGFTFYLLLILAIMYAAAYTAFIRQIIIDWRRHR